MTLVLVFFAFLFGIGLGYGGAVAARAVRNSGAAYLVKWYPSLPSLEFIRSSIPSARLKVKRSDGEIVDADLTGKRVSVNGAPGFVIDMEAGEAIHWQGGRAQYPDGVQRYKLMFSGIVDRIHTANKMNLMRYLKWVLILVGFVALFSMLAVGGVFMVYQMVGRGG